MGDIPRQVLETLAAHSAASEAARRLAAESVAAMASAGLLRLLVPARVGGAERDFATTAALITECSRHCAAAGWVLMVSTAHDWIVGSFPEAAQDDVWADGPDGITPGSLAPAGELAPADGGFRLSGRWSFNSGAAHGKWFLLGTIDKSGEKPRLYHVMVPAEDLTLDDNWHVIGLRGTGSVDALADDIHVPAHRTMDSGLLLSGRGEWAGRHATDVFRTPIVPGLATFLAAAGRGIAETAHDAALALIGGQADRYTGTRKLERPGLHMRLAEARLELDCAAATVGAAIELLAQAAQGPAGPAVRARAKYQAAYAMELCRRATGRLMDAAGSRAAFDDSPLQRAHRDLTMASKHEMINFDNAAQAYGRTIVGLDTAGFPL